MKLSVASQILPIAAFLIPFASTSADPALEALTARLAAGKLSGEDYDKMESFIDGLERSKMQPLTSVICRLSSFHLGQSCSESLRIFIPYRERC
ncbi:hypothetical protein N7488_007700 [Penicillium malachiteum]|nr:hypothetical protein N7488_007700 [Penicillium malachiteum]